MSSPLTSESSSNFRRRSSIMSLLLLAILPSAADALSERDTLLRFYNLASGDHWNAGWKEAVEAATSGDSNAEVAPVCTWHGIMCLTSDGQEAVTGIDLSYNHLSGKVSQHLWALPSLKSVNLQGNLLKDAGLQGFTSDLGSRAPIERLNLSENRLTVLDGIGSAPGTLRELHIGSNAFEGRFPGEIYRLKKLKVLRASYNAGITGTLSSEIGNMSNLRELELSYTSVRGTIPPEMGSLSQLEILSLDENRFHGNLPFELEDLVNLKYLSIQNSEEESGEITGPLLSFKDSANLKDFYLDNNALTGTIPADFLKFSLVTEKPVNVGLKHNKLVGKIPQELSRFEKLHLEVQGNHINGIPNALCHMSKWMQGRVGQFGCDAILCPKGTFAASGRRESDESECEMCPNGEADAPHLGSLDCSGTSVADVQPPSGPDASPSSSSSSSDGSNGMGGGAKFFVVILSISAFLVLGITARRSLAKRKQAKEAMEEAELEQQAKNGVVCDAADAEANAELGESGMLDIPLGGPSGPSSPGVNQCIL